MTAPAQKGKYNLDDLDAFAIHVGSIFDDYYGDGDSGEDPSDRCKELSDRLQEINERLADPELSRETEISLLHAMMNITALLRHPPCGGKVLAAH